MSDASRGRAVLVRLKPLVFLVCLIPAALLLWNAFVVVRGTEGLTALGADPVRALEIRTGLWTIRFLAITATVHYLWAVKKDTLFPLAYLATFLVLLGYRAVQVLRRRSARAGADRRDRVARAGGTAAG